MPFNKLLHFYKSSTTNFPAALALKSPAIGPSSLNFSSRSTTNQLYIHSPCTQSSAPPSFHL